VEPGDGHQTGVYRRFAARLRATIKEIEVADPIR